MTPSVKQAGHFSVNQAMGIWEMQGRSVIVRELSVKDARSFCIFHYPEGEHLCHIHKFASFCSHIRACSARTSNHWFCTCNY